MDTDTPFSQEDLNTIFKICPKNPKRVISRENSTLEFKASFGWASLPKYLKTCAAFANNKGGYIVFGITNSPHELRGLSGKSLEAFEKLDPEMFSQHFNNHFAPEIRWDISEYEMQNKLFGLLYVYEADDKPVVCTKVNTDILKEGDIYYRYRGRSERIKYSELKSILQAAREREQRLWMKHLERIARIGVRDIGIFDLHTGSVTGAESSFLIDESLLSQLTFIREGEFSESKGKPALKLIGQVEPLSQNLHTTKKKIEKTKGIRTSDIVLAALNQEPVSESDEYIKQVCFENSAFLPVYYFIIKSGMSLDQTVEMLNGVISRPPTREKLIERLTNRSTQYCSVPSSSTPAATEKQAYLEALRAHTIDASLSGKELEYCLQAIRGLSEDEIQSNSKYVRGHLRNWFNKHYASASGPLADKIRRAICWVDEALHKEGCE